MITRICRNLLKRRLVTYPAVCLLGPRQCGKTTLAKNMGGNYFDMEVEADQLRLDLEWEELCKGKELVIIDEAQGAPQFFPRMRSAIDLKRKANGRFLVLGSVAPALMRGVSESLAGRISLIELGPLLLEEMPSRKDQTNHWFYGGYPDGGILQKNRYPSWQNDYLSLLAQRDLPLWGLPADSRTTLRLFKMIAAYHGQVWNASAIGASLGISYHSVNSYLGYLENAYLVRVLQPYHVNIKKRITKSPKIYWRDSGLLHALQHVQKKGDLLDQPWVGASFEGWVIEQIIGLLRARGAAFAAYYLQTVDKQEIDLILKYKSMTWAFEIKLTSNPTHEAYVKFEKLAQKVGADHAYLVCNAHTPVVKSNRGVVNMATLNKILRM